MFGVFVSLDLMLYYGFWELSLVPMAILIAMYGRKDGPKAALKFFLFTFIPSAPLLVAILWLYAQTGSFDFVTLQILISHGSLLSRRTVLGCSRIPVRLRRQGSRLPASRMAGRHLQRSPGSPGHGGGRQARSLLHAALPYWALPCAGPSRGASLSAWPSSASSTEPVWPSCSATSGA